MPPRRPPRPTPPDVDLLRTALGQGKLVRVGIAPSGQFPDGVTGRVRRIGDPAVDGDEFIFVEVPIGGAKDVLPFAPNDLIGTPARKPAAPAAPSSSVRVGPVGPVRAGDVPPGTYPAPGSPPGRGATGNDTSHRTGPDTSHRTGRDTEHPGAGRAGRGAQRWTPGTEGLISRPWKASAGEHHDQHCR